MVSAMMLLMLVVSYLMFSGWESCQLSVEVYSRGKRRVVVEVVEKTIRQPT